MGNRYEKAIVPNDEDQQGDSNPHPLLLPRFLDPESELVCKSTQDKYMPLGRNTGGTGLNNSS